MQAILVAYLLHFFVDTREDFKSKKLEKFRIFNKKGVYGEFRGFFSSEFFFENW